MLVLAVMIIVASGQTGFAQQQGTQSAAVPGAVEAPALLTPAQLDQLVGRIALYPDELLAVVLPASTFPLQIVQAARFLESNKQNPNLQPSQQWDTSVLALLNYLDVVTLMNQDLDWTWQLGEAVINQQQDVMAAIQQFRARAFAAGNLETNPQQTVVHESQVIQIVSPNPQVIYVPRYDPVVVVQPVRYPPVTYPPPYPAYYAPGAAFFTGMFVGAAIGYGLDWRRGNIDINRNVNINNVGNRTVTGGFRGGDRSTWRPPNRGGQVGARPGYRPGGAAPGRRPGVAPGRRPGTAPGVAPGRRPGTRPAARPGTGYRQPAAAQRGTRPGARPSARYNNRGAFGGYQRGNDARRHSQRGAQSRNPSRSYGGGRRAQNRSAFSGQRSGNRSRSYSNRGSQSRRARGGGRRGGGRRR